MKLFLDVTDPEDFPTAVQIYFQTTAQNPNQEIGNRGAILALARGKKFYVVRNEESYTVREISVGTA